MRYRDSRVDLAKTLTSRFEAASINVLHAERMLHSVCWGSLHSKLVFGNDLVYCTA